MTTCHVVTAMQGAMFPTWSRRLTVAHLGRTVVWNGGADVGQLAGEPIRLRFGLRDADWYAFQFGRGDSP